VTLTPNLTRLVVGFSAAAYVVMAGCSYFAGKADANASSSSSTVSHALPPSVAHKGLPYRCIGMQIQRVDWMDKYKQSIDEIANVGADTVKFVVDSRQEHGHSSRIYLDMRMTPSADQLADLIRYAKSKKLRVILMPIVLLDKPKADEWRGKIEPEDWDMWWESYREMLGFFAWIAQGNGVDVLVVGSELVSTEGKTDEWRETIHKVRETFKGKLTYSANWDHYAGIGFWDDLDLIGMNSYWTLGKNSDASVDEIKGNWKKYHDEVTAFVEKKQKPLMFMEAGWCSMENAASAPWDYTTDDKKDDELQKRLYEGFFETWYGEPLLGGFSIWEWSPTPDAGDDEGKRATARGYTPEGKPAEKVLREWMAKPAWEVK
jgi:hypothetical protein